MARYALMGDPVVIERTLRNAPRALRADDAEVVSIPLTGDLKAMESYMIREVVKRHGGNKAAAARALGMHRRTLYRVLQSGKANAAN